VLERRPLESGVPCSFAGVLGLNRRCLPRLTAIGGQRGNPYRRSTTSSPSSWRTTTNDEVLGNTSLAPYVNTLSFP